MYIIQMADLHIGSEHETEPREEIYINKSVELIKEKVPKGADLLLCICGDIIDSHHLDADDTEQVQNRYYKAEKLILEYINLLEDYYNVSVKCCPGNHDITHGKEFQTFVNKIDNNGQISLTKLKSCYNYKLENDNIYCVFVNSCDGDQYSIGKINYEKLEDELRKLPADKAKIIILHHTIMSMFDEDSSSIRNAANLLNLIDKYKVIGVLHGHIHGRDILKVGQNHCKIIGIGAMFTRNNPNVNSQFNIIQCENGSILKAINCRYSADGGNAPWSVYDLIEELQEINYEGESFKEVYEQLLNNLKITSTLHNVMIRINNNYDKFKKDLKEYLKKDTLKIGDRVYNYFELAKMWEAEEVPDELYFNHGTYFMVDGKSGIKFVGEQLKKKSTSNRIVLPTYNMDNVIKSLDDSIYLPSLESIQFGKGKDNDELFVHMHFRALEANRFLKINICEINYILDILKKNSVEFNKVNITISAFRIQAKKRFNCFIKARIDDEKNQWDLSAKVCEHKLDELCTLLQEKRDASETITKVQGVKTIYNMMKAHNKENGGGIVYYTPDIIDILEKVLVVYAELDDIHKKLSLPNQEETDCEEEIDNLLKNLIDKLQKLDKNGRDKV